MIAVPEVAAEDAAEVAEDVAWRARRAAASWAEAATSAGARAKSGKLARGDFMAWQRRGRGRLSKEMGGHNGRTHWHPIYFSPYHTPSPSSACPSLPPAARPPLPPSIPLSAPAPPRCLLAGSLCLQAARTQRAARSSPKICDLDAGSYMPSATLQALIQPPPARHAATGTGRGA